MRLPGLPGAVIAGHTRETTAEVGDLPQFISICRPDLPAGNAIE